LFSENGYDRTTVRAVAAAAHVDPRLVMHYFGSKAALFHQAMDLSTTGEISGTPDEVVEHVLASLQASLQDEPVASLAVLRSMLTHPDAAAGVRENTAQQLDQIVHSIGGPDAVPRAGLMLAIVLGVLVGRYFLDLESLRDCRPEQLTRLLRPCLQSLARGSAASVRE